MIEGQYIFFYLGFKRKSWFPWSFVSITCINLDLSQEVVLMKNYFLCAKWTTRYDFLIPEGFQITPRNEKMCEGKRLIFCIVYSGEKKKLTPVWNFFIIFQ